MSNHRDTATPAEIKGTIVRALGTHAERMRLDAGLRSNSGANLADYRDRLRAESRRATALATIVERVSANDLAIILNAYSN